jgi:hypothetical protein
MPILENNNRLQIVETGFHGAVLGLSQDGACTSLSENFPENSLE